MKILLDTMGADAGIEAAVRGAAQAAAEFDVGVTLVGRTSDIEKAMDTAGVSRTGLDILHADDVITMEDDPSGVIRTKPGASMSVALRALGAGDADAMVSAGNTGALLVGATLYVKRVRGVRRAALAPMLPTAKGQALLIDSGANVECTPEYLLQFALMGAAYAEGVMGRSPARVALLNNGTEEKKGPPLQVQAHRLLKEAQEAGQLHFIGNIEARDVFDGGTDVLVCDGFSGNILLKTAEGIGMFFARQIKNMFLSSTKGKLAGLMVRGELQAMRSIMDYKEVGGAPILGIARPVIKAHGSSDARAFRSAIRQAVEFTRSGAIERLTRQMDTQSAQG